MIQKTNITIIPVSRNFKNFLFFKHSNQNICPNTIKSGITEVINP
jgi:hypothetical protein